MSASRHSKIPTWGKHFGFGEKHPQNTEKTRCWKSKPAPIFYNPIYNIGIPITPVYNNTFPCGMFGKPKTSIQSEFPTEELDFGAQNGCSSATWFAVSISASFSTEMKSLSWPFCTGCHQQQLTKTQRKNETTSQPFTNMFKRTWSHARKAGFVMTTWGIFVRGFSNLQLGKNTLHNLVSLISSSRKQFLRNDTLNLRRPPASWPGFRTWHVPAHLCDGTFHPWLSALVPLPGFHHADFGSKKISTSFHNKLLVKHLGYLPVVCGWDLRKHPYFLLAQRKYISTSN